MVPARLLIALSKRRGEAEARVDKLFLALGRRPNLARLRLDRLGVTLDAQGVPIHDPQTRRVDRLSIYLAGDVDGHIANLQRAAEQGRIAGCCASTRRSATVVCWSQRWSVRAVSIWRICLPGPSKALTPQREIP